MYRDCLEIWRGKVEIEIKRSARLPQSQSILQDASGRRKEIIRRLRTENQKINGFATASHSKQFFCCLICEITCCFTIRCNMPCNNSCLLPHAPRRIFHTLHRNCRCQSRNVCFQKIALDFKENTIPLLLSSLQSSRKITAIHGNARACNPASTAAQKKEHHSADILRFSKSQ